MQQDRAYERRISIRDLFFQLLYRWRSILIAALIGAILLGGFAWISNRNRPRGAARAAAETETAGTTGSLKDNYDASSALYRGLLEANRAYSENGLGMKVNPNQVWKATAVYAVIPDKTAIGTETAYNPAAPIAAAYTAVLFDEPDLEKLGGIYGEEELSYISEVASAAVTVTSNAGASFSLTAIGLTQEMAEEGLAYFEGVLERVSRGDIQQMGKHSLVRLSRFAGQAVDVDIEARQASVAKKISTYQDYITANDTSISKAPSAAKSGGKVSRKSYTIYTVAGFIFGAVLLVCIYGAAYLFSGKLRDARELTERFGVPVYGAFNHSRARRPGRGIDRLIEKWEFRKTLTDRETVLEGICTLIREQGGENGVLLTGTIPPERLQQLADSLKERLGDSVPLTSEGGFLQNTRAITEAGGASAVVIAEELHGSETEDIRRMMEVLKLVNTPVTGAVAV